MSRKVTSLFIKYRVLGVAESVLCESERVKDTMIQRGNYYVKRAWKKPQK
jgi:hypothetical protein